MRSLPSLGDISCAAYIDRPRTTRRPSNCGSDPSAGVRAFEDRRLLAVAVSDYYVVNRNETLTVGGLGLMENDQYRDWHTTDDDPVNAYGEFTSAPTHGSLAAIDGGVAITICRWAWRSPTYPILATSAPIRLRTEYGTRAIHRGTMSGRNGPKRQTATSTSTVLIQVNTPPVTAYSFTAWRTVAR